MNELSAFRLHPSGIFFCQPARRLYDRVVETLRTRYSSSRTKAACPRGIRSSMVLQAGAHPRKLAASDLHRFLTHLAIKDTVATAIQWPLNGRLFLINQGDRIVVLPGSYDG